MNFSILTFKTLYYIHVSIHHIAFFDDDELFPHVFDNLVWILSYNHTKHMQFLLTQTTYVHILAHILFLETHLLRTHEVSEQSVHIKLDPDSIGGTLCVAI
uniref:CSON015630 protein n=1 Tax=Culicoides sonorensis TaxID=179676 RepID=A0A336LTB9_CULSO